jgi:hypothetical protein
MISLMNKFLVFFSVFLIIPCFLYAQEEAGVEADRIEIATPAEAAALNTEENNQAAEENSSVSTAGAESDQTAEPVQQEEQTETPAAVSPAKAKKKRKSVAASGVLPGQSGKKSGRQGSSGKNRATGKQADKFVPPANCRGGIPGVNLSYEEREDGVVFTARGTSSRANLTLQEIAGFYLPDPGDRRRVGSLETAQDILPIVKRCFNADFRNVYFYYVEGASMKVYMTGDTPETVSQIKTALKNLETVKKRQAVQAARKKTKKYNSSSAVQY